MVVSSFNGPLPCVLTKYVAQVGLDYIVIFFQVLEPTAVANGSCGNNLSRKIGAH